MTPEGMSKLVAGWVQFYTSGLPEQIAQRRANEIKADLHDHITHERARRTSERRIALSILSRMGRGLLAAASWRRRIRPRKAKLVKPFVAIIAAAVGVGAIPVGLADDAPGFALLGILLIVIAIALGVSTTALGVGLILAAAIGLGAIPVGLADDAPGLVLIGILLIVLALAIGVRKAQRSR